MENEREQSPAEAERNRDRSRSPVGRNESQSPGDRRRDRSHRNKENRGRSGRTDVITCRRVFISNIPYELKWQNIKDLFREKVGEVTFVELHETLDGKSKGCGVVEFKDKDSVKKAIEVMHGYEIKGRQLVVKEDKEELREKSLGMFGDRNSGMMGNFNFNTFGINPQILQQLQITGPLTNKVFVANLDYKVNWQKLREIFKMAGNVVRAELKLDRDGKSKGHGVVEFEHPVEAVQAISMFNGQLLYDRAMSVRMDKYSDNPGFQDDGPAKLPGGLRGIGMGLGSGGLPINLNNFSNMGNYGMGGGMNNMGGGMGGGGMGGNMGNMGGGMGGMGGGMNNMGGGMGGSGMGMNDMSMGNMGMNNMGGNFGGMGSGMGGGMSNNDMGMGGSGGMGGSSSMGMGMGGSGMGGGTNMGMGMGGGGMGMGMSGNSMGSGMGSGMSSGMGGGGGMGGSMGGGMGLGSSMSGSKGGFGGGFGSMSDMSMSHKDDRDIGRRDRSSSITSVFIRNLPFSYTWQLLRDKFANVGEVKFAEIKNKGCGLVRFAYPDEAQRAVDIMNGTRIEGREIDVRLDRM